MLWIALDFPCLPLETFALASAHTEPWAIADGADVLVCNEPARALGVRAGMRLSAACALAPQLNYRLRDAAAEAAALATLAAWAGQFTPNVSLEPPRALLLDIEGSLRLFGGIRPILQALKRGLDGMGYSATMACAPTATAALLLARAGMQKIVNCKRALEAVVATLPLAALECDARTAQTLQAVGVKRVGDLMALPRDGVARRGGQPLLDSVDRALGRLPAPRQFFTPPAQFNAELELAAPVAHSEALLFAAKRLLTQLAGFLAARNGGVQRFTLTLLHERGTATPHRDRPGRADARQRAPDAARARTAGGAGVAGARACVAHRSERYPRPRGGKPRTVRGLAPARQASGKNSSSACARGWARRRCTVWRLKPNTVPNARGARPSPAPRARRPRADRRRHDHYGCSPLRSRSGKSPRGRITAKMRWRWSRGPSASNPAGGTVTTSSAITSSRKRRIARRCGFTANGARPAAGICTASSVEVFHASALPAYAELHCVSNFTFLRGASHPEELAARAAQLGYAALAITDECSLAGVVRAHVAAKEHNLKLIIGAEFRLADGPKLVLLATDREAYGDLSQLITTARRRSAKGSYRLDWSDLDRGAGDCLALLIPDQPPDPAVAQRIAARFPDRAWIAVELLCGPDDRAQLDAAARTGPCVRTAAGRRGRRAHARALAPPAAGHADCGAP